MTEVPIITETSPSVCSVNQWIGFYMIVTSVMRKVSPCPHRTETSQFIWIANIYWFVYDENTVKMLKNTGQ